MAMEHALNTNLVHKWIRATRRQEPVSDTLTFIPVAMAVLAWQSQRALRGQMLAVGLWFAGMVLFSGSLYALVLSGTKPLGIITPFGGLLLMAGWLVLAWSAWRQRPATA